MLTVIVGILLFITYIGLIIYAAKGGNLMIGFLVMAILWAILGWIGGTVTWKIANEVIFEGGPESYAVTAVVVIFGSWFGRILVETGIASTIIKKTVELSGDKPAITTILLCIVTALIFTSTFGAGVVVAIGVIVLPILLSLGVKKSLAVTSYLMSVGAGMYVNVVLFKQMQGLFPQYQYDSNYLKFGFTAFGVQLVVVIIMVLFNLSKKEVNHAWAAQVEPEDSTATVGHVPYLALVTPIIPVFLAIAFHWQPIPAMVIACFFALFLTGKAKSFQKLVNIVQKTFHDGVMDVAMLLGFLLILPMFNKAASVNAPFFKAILGSVIPSSVLALCIAFAVFALAGLFRGPLTAFGSGAATLAILQSVGVFSSALLFPLLYIPTITMNISCCPTQSWNLWGINYVKIGVKDFMKTGIVWGWIICVINIAVVYFMFK